MGAERVEVVEGHQEAIMRAREIEHDDREQQPNISQHAGLFSV